MSKSSSSWLSLKRYFRDDFFLYNLDCTYVLSKMLLGPVCPMLTMSAPMVVQVQVLGPAGYRPCLLQIFADQMVDTGWIVKSTYFWLCGHGARCRALSESAKLSCSQPLIGSFDGVLIPFLFLDCCWGCSGTYPDPRQWSGRWRPLQTIRVSFGQVFGAPPCGAFYLVGDLSQARAVDIAVVGHAESSEPSSPGLEDGQGSKDR